MDSDAHTGSQSEPLTSGVHLRQRVAQVLSLVGAGILTGLTFAELPSASFSRLPVTPYDNSSARGISPVFRFLSTAAAEIPIDAAVVVRSNPPDPRADTELHRIAVALLPGRHILPAALWGQPVPQGQEAADFLLVPFGRVDEPGWKLYLDLPTGTVWSRER